MLRGLLFFLLLFGLSAGAAHAERRIALLMGNSALLVWLCLATSALAENRLALVIGNEGYQHIAALQKAKADAKGYADLLREKGYSVQEGYDLGFMEMLGAVARFAKKIQPGDTAVFVYSGHGWSDGTTNYVVGVDAPASEGQEVLSSVSVPIRNGLNGVLDNFTRKGAGLKVAIIDACRDNPFQPPSGERGYGLERGLRPQSIEGSFVIYSAGEGQAAMDRLSEADADPNSVFTRTLLPLLRADLPLTEAIKASQEKTHALAASADHNQMPAYYDEVLGRACLSAVCKSAIEQVPDAPTPKPVDSNDPAGADYYRAKGVGSAMAWEAFLRMHQSGFYAEVAKGELGKLARQENPHPIDPPGPGSRPKSTEPDEATRPDQDRPKDVGLPENSNPNQPLDAGLPLRPKPTDPDAAHPGHDRSKDVGPIEHAAPGGGPQQVARLESPKPSEGCVLEFESGSVDAAGVGHFAVKDSCGRLNALSIDYGGRTFTQAATSPNRAEFTFDFFAGPSALTIRATDDGRFLQYQAPYFDQSGLAKAVIIWHGTTDLDLHAFENSAEPNSAKNV
jgi:hypothetical protein